MKFFKTLAPFAGIGGLLLAYIIYRSILKVDAGSEKMQQIADLIHEGAMVFLKSEYRILAVFVLFVATLIFFYIGHNTAYAFLAGTSCSMLAGFFGMKAATKTNVRTSAAANNEGMGAALMVAFGGGSVMGLSVASLGLTGLSIVFYSD